jgi:hypothetical protein
MEEGRRMHVKALFPLTKARGTVKAVEAVIDGA